MRTDCGLWDNPDPPEKEIIEHEALDEARDFVEWEKGIDWSKVEKSLDEALESMHRRKGK